MQQKINMDLLFVNSDDKISLDEIVVAVADAFQNKAYVELLKMILAMVQEIAISRYCKADGASKYPSPCGCVHGGMVLNGHYNRRIRTSLGEVNLRVVKLKCTECRKSFAPLLKHIGFVKYQTKSNELEKLVVEAVSDTSYRLAMKQLENNGKYAPPFRTANSWTIRTNCDELQLPGSVSGSYNGRYRSSKDNHEGTEDFPEVEQVTAKCEFSISFYSIFTSTAFFFGRPRFFSCVLMEVYTLSHPFGGSKPNA